MHAFVVPPSHIITYEAPLILFSKIVLNKVFLSRKSNHQFMNFFSFEFPHKGARRSNVYCVTLNIETYHRLSAIDKEKGVKKCSKMQKYKEILQNL